jgi:glycogen debranching enzyme
MPTDAIGTIADRHNLDHADGRDLASVSARSRQETSRAKEPDMLDLDLLVKNNELCLVGRAYHHDNLHEAGLYVRDTRFLNGYALTLNNAALQVLTLQSPSPDRAMITGTNPHLMTEGRNIPPHTILVRQEISLDTALVVTLAIRNFDMNDVSVTMAIDLGADFKDMFDVRGMTPRQRPTLSPAQIIGDGVALSARSSDDQVISTHITSIPPADIVPRDANDMESGVTLRYRLDLPRGAERSIELRIAPKPVGEPLRSASSAGPGSEFAPHVSVQTSSEAFNAFIAQCDRDLALLQTSFPEGNIPAAGIPWYIAPFGRDSLIVALQTIHAYPERVASTLQVLAALQGTRVDAWREEQPGKILHEMRYGDMARTGQVPHTPYFGSIDSTPLFVMVFAQHYLWHRDDALFERLLDNVRRALEWIDAYGDLDGDGLLEFSGIQQDMSHISQQGWKDSHDSLHFADGREVQGPIALVEVQGYAYAAFAWLSEAVRLRGDAAWADDLQQRAGRVRETVEARFWLHDAGYYAQALDGQKQPIDAISSNPGHLLFCGLPSAERAAKVAARMAAPDLNAGRGIRTLSTEMATYNPMSYHNGSIWPHDVSLAMAGLQAYGHDELACALAMGLLDLTTGATSYRLAELYCGFPKSNDGLGPVNYPVSCSPQAWAAGAGLIAVRTLLGLRPDSGQRGIFVAPRLPDAWDHLNVSGLYGFGRSFDLSVQRSGEGYTTLINAEVASIR